MRTRTQAQARTDDGVGKVRMVMLGMVLTLLAAIGVSAWAQPGPPPGMEGRPGMMQGRGGWGEGHEHGGGMFGHRGGHHGGMGGMGMGGMGGMGGGMMLGGSPERMGRMIDRMLDGLNASDAQRTQIKQIAGQAATDLRAQAVAGRGLHQRAMQIFAAPTVDAAAAEQLRQQMLSQHDQMSRRATQAMLAVANVLTPEQRAKVGERMRDRQARMEDRMKRMERDGPRR